MSAITDTRHWPTCAVTDRDSPEAALATSLTIASLVAGRARQKMCQHDPERICRGTLLANRDDQVVFQLQAALARRSSAKRRRGHDEPEHAKKMPVPPTRDGSNSEAYVWSLFASRT